MWKGALQTWHAALGDSSGDLRRPENPPVYTIILDKDLEGQPSVRPDKQSMTDQGQGGGSLGGFSSRGGLPDRVGIPPPGGTPWSRGNPPSRGDSLVAGESPLQGELLDYLDCVGIPPLGGTP